MSKAENRAQAAYPAWRNGIDYKFNSSSAYCGFIEGYHQAEKDLELTWEDCAKIDDIASRLDGLEEVRDMSNKEFYQEVLKRFKAQNG